MANVSMKDFLLQYYMQLRFNEMPPEVRAKYMEFAKNDDFRGNMKEWKTKLMHMEDGELVNNELPDPTTPGGQWELSPEEWQSFYKAFQNAFRTMAANRGSFEENKKANAFLDENFGDPNTHLFSHGVADANAETEIQGELKDFLTKYQGILPAIFRQWGILDKDFSYSDLMSGIRSKKYNKDPNFQKKLIDVADYLTSYKNDPDFRARLQLNDNEQFDFQNTINGFDNDDINPAKLDYFKNNYRTLLNPLAREKDIKEVFANYDSGKITSNIDKANKKLDYDDKTSDNYIPPKRKDELTPWQEFKDYVGDTYDAVLGKYLSKHGNRMYFSNSAKLIVGAIDGAKIKPTDGLAKVLENADTIKKNLLYKSPTATKHFEWFTKTMDELKNTMPKAFAGAMNDGQQLKAIVAEMAMMAIRQNKIKEAETAMEVLSVIKYGYTTSKIMDALGKEKFSIFSDKGLSWNKNQTMQMVTTAVDHTIKTAFMAFGYGITIAGNAYKLSGSKFNGDMGRMTKESQKWAAKNQADKNAAIADRDAKNAADRTLGATYEAQLAALNTGADAVNAGNLGQRIADIDARKADQNRQLENLYAIQSGPAYQNAATKVENIETLNSSLEENVPALQDINNKIAQLRTQISAIDAKISNRATYHGMPGPAADALALQLTLEKSSLESTLKEQEGQRQKLLDSVRDDLGKYKTETGQAWHAGVTNHGAAYDAAHQVLSDYERDEQNYQNYVNETNRKQEKVDEFNSATATLQELNDRMAKRDEIVNQWDAEHKSQYVHLMKYWDMLETGRNSHTGPMYKWDLFKSTKDSQAKFDAQKAGIMNDYFNSYQNAA